MNVAATPLREGFQSVEPKPAETKPAAAAPAAAAPTPTPAPEPAPAPPPEPEPPAEVWPIKVQLRKPLRLEGGRELSELSFREPTGGDINRYGNPVRIDTAGEVIIDERKMSMMIGALSGVLTPYLDRLDPRDWNTCAYRLRNFFIPEPWW